MRAILVRAAGADATVGDLPEPTAGFGEVVVQVRAAALNPMDALIAKGLLSNAFPHEYPIVLGRDAAGVVTAVGEGVEGLRVGDSVFGHVPFGPPIHAGVLSDRAALRADAVALRPAHLDDRSAAALPLSGTAAATLVDAVEANGGQTILVNGASGGVGSFVVQMLAGRDVEVIATGTADDADRLTRLGASRVLDFTQGSIADQLLAVRPEGVDALVNVFGMTLEQVPIAAVRKGGRVATITSAPKADAIEAAGLRGGIVTVTPRTEVLEQLAREAADGRLSVEIEAVVPPTEALAWLWTIAAGNAHGKIVVDMTA